MNGAAIWTESRRSKGPNTWLLYYTYSFVLFVPYLINVILGLEWLDDASYQTLSLVRSVTGTFHCVDSYSGPSLSSGIIGWWSGTGIGFTLRTCVPLAVCHSTILTRFISGTGAVGRGSKGLGLAPHYLLTPWSRVLLEKLTSKLCN
jgi:hypothetical protein